MPFFDNSCPYRTPLTYVLVIFGWTICLVPCVAFFTVYGVLIAAFTIVIGATAMAVVSIILTLYSAWFLVLLLLVPLCLIIFAIQCVRGEGLLWALTVWAIIPKRTPPPPFKRAWRYRLGLIPRYTLGPVIFWIGHVRFYIYAWSPTRRLPGHKVIPVHVPRRDNLSNNNKRNIGEKHFVDDTRLLFLWTHTSGYLSDPKESVILLDHIPRRLLNFDKHNYGSFFVHLRHSDAFMKCFTQSMQSIESWDTGLGVLKLLQKLISAKHGQEYSISGLGRDERWDVMDTYNMPDHFFTCTRQIIHLSHQYNLESDVKVLAEFMAIRRQLILAQLQLLPNMYHYGNFRIGDFESAFKANLRYEKEDWIKNMFFLERMLLSHESIEGFGLIALYSDSRSPLDDDDLEHILQGYELAIRGILTLLVNCIHARIYNRLNTKGYLETIMTAWYTLTTREDLLKTFSEASRKRRPSTQLIRLFSDWKHDYEYVLDEFKSLFNLPAPLTIHNTELEPVDRALKEYRITFRSDPGTSPNPSSTRTEHMGRSLRVQASQSFAGENPPSRAVVNHESDNHIQPTPDFIAVGSAFDTLSASTPEQNIPLPPSPDESEGGQPVSSTLAPIVGQEVPDSPSLRSAEEGVLGLAEVAA
ncbi:hypothetical protein PENSPDRAFT_671427 [Peniophora sp. CONT]|nr:hypothetical protein PENSPDRAFT_671427 [Peniophora sp. CONT]